ncbi:MAG: hypothetical protein ACJAQT_004798 [Akkermansiaceae bacterium]|jgi:hypothetical protein
MGNFTALNKNLLLDLGSRLMDSKLESEYFFTALQGVEKVWAQKDWLGRRVCRFTGFVSTL